MCDALSKLSRMGMGLPDRRPFTQLTRYWMDSLSLCMVDGIVECAFVGCPMVVRAGHRWFDAVLSAFLDRWNHLCRWIRSPGQCPRHMRAHVRRMSHWTCSNDERHR